MNQSELLALAISILEDLGLTYMVVGSIASGTYGEPRMTRDIDIVIAPSCEDDIERLCAAFPSDDFYVSREAALEAMRNGTQFNVIHPESGDKVDFMIAGRDAWGRQQVQRRQRVRILPDKEGFAAGAEDIILSKMAYYKEGGSEKHLRDIAGILKVGGTALDRAYIERWAESLGVTEVWNAVLARVSQR